MGLGFGLGVPSLSHGEGDLTGSGSCGWRQREHLSSLFLTGWLVLLLTSMGCGGRVFRSSFYAHSSICSIFFSTRSRKCHAITKTTCVLVEWLGAGSLGGFGASSW